MPIDHKDPDDNGDYQKHEDEDKNPVNQRESVAARGAEGAGDEPVDIEEDGDDDEEGKGDVDDLFGIMLEGEEQEQANGYTQNESNHENPYQTVQKTGRRRKRIEAKPGGGREL